MKTLYLECGMGAAGDMLMAALYDLMDEGQKASFLEQMNALGIEGVHVEMEQVLSYGISGAHAHVLIDGVEEGDVLASVYDGLAGEYEHHHGHSHGHHHHHEHHEHHHHGHEHGHHHHHGHDHEHIAHDLEHHTHEHASPQSVAAAIEHTSVPIAVRTVARAVYESIAQAEARVHNEAADMVHYHEVGAKDAIADVVGVCLAMSILAPDEVVVSPIHVGSGTVQCAHGTVPVPAPATLELLKGAPIYGGELQGELCTPTGAALLTHFANSYEALPAMEIERIGYGIGVRDFGRANCLRAFLGTRLPESAQMPASLATSTSAKPPSVVTQEAADSSQNSDHDTIAELVCNIDDMTPEALAHACARLVERGALDAYTTAGTMKKGRSGHVLSVLCTPENADAVAKVILQETSTNGLRIHTARKLSLTPHIEEVQTEWGSVRIKIAEGYGVRHVKPEYDDVSCIAAKTGLPFSEVFNAALKAGEKRSAL